MTQKSTKAAKATKPDTPTASQQFRAACKKLAAESKARRGADSDELTLGQNAMRKELAAMKSETARLRARIATLETRTAQTTTNKKRG